MKRRTTARGQARAVRQARAFQTAALALALLAALALPACASGGAGSNTLSLLTVFPLTGPNRALGQAMRQAVDLAVSQNATLGGYHLSVTHVDEALGSASQVVAADIAAGSVVGVVGPFSGESALTIEPIVARAGVTTITPTATLAGLTQAGSAQTEGLAYASLRPQGAPITFLRLPPTSDAEGKAAAAVARASGAAGLAATSIFVVDDGTPSGKAIAAAFKTELGARHGRVAGYASVSGADLSDPLGLVAAIVKTGPDAVFYAGDTLTCAQVRSALTLSGLPGLPLLAASPVANNPGWTDAVGGPLLAGATMALLPGRDLAKLASAQAFVRSYQQAYPGAQALPQAALAYDAAMDEISALKAAISAGKPPTASAVLTGVTAATYHGVTGDIAFDKNGDNTKPPPFSVYSCDTKGVWTFRGSQIT